MVSIEAVTHESKADCDQNRGKMNRESKADLFEGAAAGQVAEGIGKKGREQLEKEKYHRVVVAAYNFSGNHPVIVERLI